MGRQRGLIKLFLIFFKKGSEFLLPCLHDIVNKNFDTADFPEVWTRAAIVPIFKSGDKNDKKNYRGISLLSVSSKVFMSVLQARLMMWTETNNLIAYEQVGFRMDHSTTDHIFTLHQINFELFIW